MKQPNGSWKMDQRGGDDYPNWKPNEADASIEAWQKSARSGDTSTDTITTASAYNGADIR